MKSVNVVDLDKTLINYDSFRRLIFRELKRPDFYLLLITAIRVFRLISSESYKRKVIIYFKQNFDTKYFEAYANFLFKDINNEIFNMVKKETSINTTNVLLSASPDFYVKFLAQKLSWVGKGSYFNENGKFIHMYGLNKKSWMEKNFDPKKYIYNFSISDSSSDDDLLSLFFKKTKVTSLKFKSLN